VSPLVKAALGRLAELTHRLADTRREVAHVRAQINEIVDDQARLRPNLKEVPPTAAAYKRYLEKFDRQETEIESLRADLKTKLGTEKAQVKELEDYVGGLSVE
jgi:chromosome segregation ATPase